MQSETFCILTAVVFLIQQRVISDWWEVPLTMKGVWRSTTMENGVLCVMTVGTLLMPMWCAVSSITAEPHQHLDKPSLVQAAAQSTMTTWPALGVKHAWLTAPILVLEFTIAVTAKMLG